MISKHIRTVDLGHNVLVHQRGHVHCENLLSRLKSVSNRLKKDINSRPVSEKAYQQGPYTAHAMASSPVWDLQSSSPRLSNVHISPSSTLLLDGTYADALIKSIIAKRTSEMRIVTKPLYIIHRMNLLFQPAKAGLGSYSSGTLRSPNLSLYASSSSNLDSQMVFFTFPVLSFFSRLMVKSKPKSSSALIFSSGRILLLYACVYMAFNRMDGILLLARFFVL